jgi:cytochrome P450
MAAVWSLHHDPAFWTDPFYFDPERFAPENRDKIIEMTYMPFGDGPRNCIGRRFALMEAKMTLVEVFRRYTVTPFSFSISFNFSSFCRYTVTTSQRTPSPLPVRNKGLTLAVVGDSLWLRATQRS